jgi:hypothetical protein
MMRRIVLTGAVVLALSGGQPASADQVHLANGQALEGLVLRQTDSQVVVQVAWEGHIVLDRASVASIEPSTDAERKALMTRWQLENEAYQKRDQRQREFEDQQIAAGLVQYRGQWVTREELEGIRNQAKAAADERRERELAEKELKREAEARKRAEQELTSASERLRALQEEQVRLQQEISSLRLLLARTAFVQTGPRFVRDANGNLLRIKTHDNHRFVETPDGAHNDLTVENGVWSYTDGAGVRHEVKPTTR